MPAWPKRYSWLWLWAQIRPHSDSEPRNIKKKKRLSKHTQRRFSLQVARRCSRQSILRLGMKPVTAGSRVTIKRTKNVIRDSYFPISYSCSHQVACYWLILSMFPDPVFHLEAWFFKSLHSETYIIFGEAKIKDLSSQLQMQAAQQFRMPDMSSVVSRPSSHVTETLWARSWSSQLHLPRIPILVFFVFSPSFVWIWPSDCCWRFERAEGMFRGTNGAEAGILLPAKSSYSIDEQKNVEFSNIQLKVLRSSLGILKICPHQSMYLSRTRGWPTFSARCLANWIVLEPVNAQTRLGYNPIDTNN